MSVVDDFLAHYGVAGMKWGVRREAKRIAKADSKFEKKAYSYNTAVKLYNAAANAANNDLPSLNKKWENVDLTKPGKQQEAYYKEATANLNKHLQKQADALGLNPSGTKKVQANFDSTNGRMNVVLVDIKHDAFENLSIDVERNSNGLIIKYIINENIIEQTAFTTEEFLSHYGVTGMKWGVRKSRNEAARAKTFGNRGKPNTKGYSKDAKRATNIRQKAKESPVKVKSLSNEEIQTFLTRVNLETRFIDATPGPGARVMKTVKNLLGIQNTVNQAANSPVTQAVKSGFDKKLKKSG